MQVYTLYDQSITHLIGVYDTVQACDEAKKRYLRARLLTLSTDLLITECELNNTRLPKG